MPRCDAHAPLRIALTGGPGAGKTAVLEIVRRAMCDHVKVLPESASIVFGGGFPRGSGLELRRAAQRAIFYVQRELEAAAMEDALAIALCDRGTVDGAAYWPGPGELWAAVGTTLDEQLARYHARDPSPDPVRRLQPPESAPPRVAGRGPRHRRADRHLVGASSAPVRGPARTRLLDQGRAHPPDLAGRAAALLCRAPAAVRSRIACAAASRMRRGCAIASGNHHVALARCLLCSNSMGHITNLPPTQHVYRGRGLHSVRIPPCDRSDPPEIKVPTIADSVSAVQIMSQEVICAREDLDLEALTDLILRRHIGCVPVVDADGHPIGMITKFDLVEQLLAADDPEAAPPVLTAGQLMMPIALTLDEHATVAHVAAMMAVEDIHHIPIVGGDGCLIGVVSSMDIVRWLAANDGFLLQDPSPAGSS